MKLIHLGSQVLSVFAWLDDEGNVAQEIPVQGKLQIFAPEAFTEAYEAVKVERDKLLDAAAKAQAAQAQGIH